MSRVLARAASLALLLSCLLTACSAHASSLPGQSHRSGHPSRLPDTSAPIATLLQQTWQGYKSDFIQGDGRVIDHTRVSVTTSEGQSYAMLRSVWMNDRGTFDLVWSWTRRNLQVRRDKLFGYLWGQRNGGPWTILSTDSATDADEDIALALIFASKRWNDRAYLSAASQVLRDIWRREVTRVRGRPYLTAGSWAPSQKPGPVVDPSYLAPYAYRIFARVDRGRRWGQLVRTSYAVLAACSRSRLSEKRSVDLPPNWCMVSRRTGAAVPARRIPAGDDFGYDAFRVMWRTALDYLWNRELAAKSYLTGSSFLRRQWDSGGRLFAQYAHDGRVVTNREDPTIYGGVLGNFLVASPVAASAIATTKLASTFHQDGGVAYFDQRYNYYEQNWVWFGLALYAGKLVNLYG